MIFAPRWRRAAQGPRHRHRSAAERRRRETDAQGRRKSEGAAHGRQQEPAPGFRPGAHVWHSSAPGHREAWAFAYQGTRVAGCPWVDVVSVRASARGARPECRERDGLAVGRPPADHTRKPSPTCKGARQTDVPHRTCVRQDHEASPRLSRTARPWAAQGFTPRMAPPMASTSRATFRPHAQAAGWSGDFPAGAAALWSFRLASGEPVRTLPCCQSSLPCLARLTPSSKQSAPVRRGCLSRWC